MGCVRVQLELGDDESKGGEKVWAAVLASIILRRVATTDSPVPIGASTK